MSTIIDSDQVLPEQRDERNMSGVHQWNLSDLASCALPAPVRKLLEQHALP